MHTRQAMASASVLALLAGGCAPDAPADGQASAESAITLIEELRIGGLDGAEEYTFGSVSVVAPSPDGTVLIGDRQVPVLRRYDSSGQYVQDIGRRGEGPGEYLALDGAVVLDDGRIVLWDGRLRRLSVFDSAGEFVSSSAIPVGLGGFRTFVGAPAGHALLRVMPESGFVESRDGVQADWARVTLDGTVERLLTIPPENPTGPRYVLAGRGGYYRPFNVATLSTISPNGGFYHVRNDEYAIQHEHPDGSATVISRDEPRIALRSEERAEWEARSESFAERAPDQRSEFFPIPDVKPYIRELVTDIDGRLWVSRYTEAAFMEYSEAEAAERREQNLPSYQWRDLLRWDVFTPQDEYLGHVTLPFKTTFITAHGDVVWGVQAGDYREDYVVRWRMDSP